MKLGKGTKVWHPNKSYIADDFECGENCVVAAMVHIDRDVKWKDNVRCQGMVYMPPKTRIGSNVFIAPAVAFSNDPIPMAHDLQGVIVEDNVMIMMGSQLRGGVTIGKGAVIGMSAVVTKDVPPNEVWFGNPASFRYTRMEYDRKHDQA